MLNSTEYEINPAHKCSNANSFKTFITTKNIAESLKTHNIFIFQHFSFFWHLKFVLNCLSIKTILKQGMKLPSNKYRLFYMAEVCL